MHVAALQRLNLCISFWLNWEYLSLRLDLYFFEGFLCLVLIVGADAADQLQNRQWHRLEMHARRMTCSRKTPREPLGNDGFTLAGEYKFECM